MILYHKTTKNAISLLANPATFSHTGSTASLRTKRGFTIVELLIVIVVIGILAAISLVSYNGISQNAKNATTIAAAKQAVNAINLYIAEKGTYPSTANRCLTTEQACNWSSIAPTNSEAFQALLRDYGGLPGSVPSSGSSDYNGIYYGYGAGWTFNGASRPAAVIYGLSGTNQKCQLPNVANTGASTRTASVSGYTANAGGVATACVVVIDGPPHS